MPERDGSPLRIDPLFSPPKAALIKNDHSLTSVEREQQAALEEDPW